MKLKIKKLNERAYLPEYKRDTSGMMDIRAIDISSESRYIEYRTGLSISVPIGYIALIFPRNDIAQTDLVLSNAACVIDSDYRGELILRFKRVFEEDQSDKIEPCDSCNGVGSVYEDPNDKESLEIPCSYCEGTGETYDIDVYDINEVIASLIVLPIIKIELDVEECKEDWQEVEV